MSVAGVEEENTAIRLQNVYCIHTFTAIDDLSRFYLPHPSSTIVVITKSVGTGF